MLTYPNISPIAFEVPLPFIGDWSVRWYGLMYLLGFLVAYLMGCHRAKRFPPVWNKEVVADLIFFCAVGLVLGGRIGYMLFYQFPILVRDPMSLLRIWEGGMSFHGGFIGTLIVLFLFSRKIKRPMAEAMDFTIVLVPFGLGAGRIGNFIGAELYGRVTTVPWGMVFPNAGPLPRHPSQLYQFLLEGVLLFVIMWLFSRKPRPLLATSGVFAIFYGIFRFMVEFVRQPDAQLGFVAFNWMSMGQLLSLPMVLVGCLMVIYAYRVNRDRLV